MKKMFTIALSAAFAMTTVGCFGSFGLTKKVYNFHKSIGDKWINEVVFFVIGGPVYGFTTFADAVVLNSIEFWTGSNPIASNTMEQTDEHGNKLVATKLPGGALDLTSIQADGTVHQLTLINSGEAVQVYNEQGKVVAQVSTVSTVTPR